jgi:enoyl-CoA hydratase
MSERIIRDGDVIVRELGSLRRMTLNRPKALNAITLDMAVTMTAYMREWADDPAAGAVMLDAAGGRAFAAGGDIRALYDAAKSGDPLPERFWATEYHLNVLIARYRKSVIAIMDGVVMGGGVGLASHAAHRIVTERSSVAMPEVGIGFFPDVGVAFLLARAPGALGTYLMLTGDRVGAADAIYCGLADIHIPTAKLADVPAALAGCHTAEAVRERLDAMATAPATGRLHEARSWIDRCFGADDVAAIVERLRRRGDDESIHVALGALEKASPTSLKVTLRNARSALSFSGVEQSFQQDYRIALACIAGHDFIEGIRAAIVDKDRNPAWRPARLEEVTEAVVERHFKPVGALELKFPE